MLAVLAQLVVVTTVAVAVRQSTVRSYVESTLVWKIATGLGAFCEAVFVAVLYFDRRKNFSRLHEWSFWISAFAHDQFEERGACSEHDDVMKSAFVEALCSDSVDSAIAVIDDDGVIGRRVWCGFELYWARANLNNKLLVDTVSATGLLGQGDSNEGSRATMLDLIDSLEFENAQCTYSSDKDSCDANPRSRIAAMSLGGAERSGHSRRH
ncbi:unnamed protein product [Prorocentrum cordatum]|uniref:Uncharacterized protein n=1 Tax=Prorocentrum cordatum TaxID=2364126 RepID=A0ABN9SF01_9DINO|nr:unnamed protein product [Polarella glacialis]